MSGMEEWSSRCRRRGRMAGLLLWLVNTQARGHCDTAVGSTVARVIASSNPRPGAQVVDVNVIKPNAVQILTTDDEKSIPGDGGEVSVAGFGRGDEGVVVEGP